MNWDVFAWVLAVLFNIGAVAGIRRRIKQAGERFLTRGRGAFVLLFVLTFLERLIAGHFAALDSPEAFIKLVQESLALVAAAMGLHVTGGTWYDLAKQLFRSGAK